MTDTERLKKLKEFILSDMCNPCKNLEEVECDECNVPIMLDIIEGKCDE